MNEIILLLMFKKNQKVPSQLSTCLESESAQSLDSGF